MRQIKKQIAQILREPDFLDRLNTVTSFPDKLVAKTLISFLCDSDETVRWRAVTAMGEIADRIVRKSIEDSRVLMRQLIWNLNEESGGIGWGCPEAMGEIMARNPALAREFSGLLVSYITPGDNYLGHEPLLQGVLWGIGRLARGGTVNLEEALPHLAAFAQSDDPVSRGLAVWAVSIIDKNRLKDLPAALFKDDREIRIYEDGRIETRRISRMAGGMNG